MLDAAEFLVQRWPHVLRPLPAWLVGRSADRQTADVDDLEFALHHLPHFVGLLEALENCVKHSTTYAAATGAGPASTSCLVTGSTRRVSPSSVRAPSKTRSPASPNTTSSAVLLPATCTRAAPAHRSRIEPSAWRKRHLLYRSIPRDSSSSDGTHDNSAPVSTSADISR